MSRKIITFWIINIFLLTSITSSLSIAEKLYVKNEVSNTIKITNLENIDDINTRYIKKTIQNAITHNKKSDILFDINLSKNLQEIEGGYSFSPCYYIDITGQGNAELIPPVLIWNIDEGHVNINDFNREYSSDVITATGFFIAFEGSMTINPLEICGTALFGCLIENSNLVKVTTEKVRYKRNENIVIITTNIGDADIEINNPHFYILNIDSDIVFEEKLEETIVIKPEESKMWSWNQKDKNGKMVPKGNYSILGEFPINDRTHVAGVEFILTGKKVRSANAQFLMQIL
jgi:hypothetical protein